jgi:hypothetical protein
MGWVYDECINDLVNHLIIKNYKNNYEQRRKNNVFDERN